MKTLEYFKINDRVAVITGGGGLMGKMHAEVVLDLGGKVILVDVDSYKLDKILDEFDCIHQDNIETYLCDITKKPELIKLASFINQKYGQLDILINNAAVNPKVEDVDENKKLFSNLENYSIESWDVEVNVGLKGAFLCAQVLGPHLRNDGGVIVNISSDLGMIAPNQNIYSNLKDIKGNQYIKPISYSAVKFGIIGLTKYLSTYMAKDGIRCNALLPGGIYAGQNNKFKKKIEQLIPLKRMASVDDYRGAIAFLISDASIYMTGSNLIVDGGRTAW